MNYQLSNFFVLLHRLIESHPPYLKNRRDPHRSLLTGEIGVGQRGYPGQKKQHGRVTKGQAPQITKGQAAQNYSFLAITIKKINFPYEINFIYLL